MGTTSEEIPEKKSWEDSQDESSMDKWRHPGNKLERNLRGNFSFILIFTNEIFNLELVSLALLPVRRMNSHFVSISRRDLVPVPQSESHAL